MNAQEYNILKRYYRGETTLEEERMLKASFRSGNLPDNPMLAFQARKEELPVGLTEKIQTRIHSQRNHRIQSYWITAGSIAALFLLFFSIRSLIPHSQNTCLQLSDNLKKERFENALRVLGSALEETPFPSPKVVYEDNRLIIEIE